MSPTWVPDAKHVLVTLYGISHLIIQKSSEIQLRQNVYNCTTKENQIAVGYAARSMAET